MKLPYASPPHAWRYVILLHKLAGLDDSCPLRITPVKTSSIHTARAKLFQGRQYILETDKDNLATYYYPALCTQIHTAANRLEVTRTDKFNDHYSNLKQDEFTVVYRQLVAKLLNTSGPFVMSLSPFVLDRHQAVALQDFLRNNPSLNFAQVTSTSITVGR